jgi:hypothetical protein
MILGETLGHVAGETEGRYLGGTMGLTADQNTQLDALVADVRAKEDAFGTASDTNDAAQTAAQAAVATAAGMLAAKNNAHDALEGSLDALVTFVQGLK